MQCSRCQHENEAGAKFCEECAASLARTCANCSWQLSPTAKFCPECAHPAELSAATPPVRRFGSPEAYIPKHLAEKILTSRSALEGERKQVTVLFADLKDSMELIADRDPEEAHTILDPVVERMMEAVHRYEGMVNQVMGDGIMALFGAPLAHEDHAVRACYAALWMQDSVKRYADTVRRSHDIEIQIRVGMNSGDVVVRSVGSDLRMDYTAVGQTTHLAARMEQLATPGTIRLTNDTLRLAEGFIAVKPLGPLPVRGLAEPIEVYEATGVGVVRTRLQAAARRGLTRFVGRDTELEGLRRAQGLAANGHGQVVAIVGEAGVGKSRLVYEFIHSPRLQSWLVLESASVSYGKATSYLPVIGLLKGYFRIQDRDDLSDVREKVTGKLLTLDRTLETTLPALLSLLDVPVDDGTWTRLDPAQRRQRTLQGVKALLLREAREQPLLLIFEDLHWVDGETQALLDSLVESLASARLLLLVNYRPEYEHRWSSKTYYSQVRLDALPAESAGELLEALLGEEPALAPLKRLLVKRGNPFFLEETVRTLVETKTLAGERGRYRLTQPVQAPQVPATVQAVLAARIDRLPPENKRLLQVASVVGKDVSFVLLQAIADLSDDALGCGLDQLQAAEFLYETGLYPDLEYSFKHALTHEVAYSGLLHERRHALHARIVGAIETVYRERLADQVERLAHHAVRGEVWDKAVSYLKQAADRAAERSAYRAATLYLEEGLAALAHLPANAETTAHAIDLRFEIRNSLFALGEHARIRTHLEEAQHLAEFSHDKGRLAWVFVYMSNYFWREGDPETAVTVGRKALTIADELDDFPLRITATFRLGQGYHALGDYRRTAECLRENILGIPSHLSRSTFGLAGLPSVFSRAFLVWSLAELGQFPEGLAHGKEAIDTAASANQMYSRSMAHFTLGFLHLRKGELDGASNLLESGLTIQQSGEILALRAMFLAALGYVHTLRGQLDRALPLLEQSVEPATFSLSPQHLFPFLFLAESYLEAGLIERSAKAALQGLQLCRARADSGSEAYALHLLGAIASAQRPLDVDRAQEHYRHALALATKLGMQPLLAHCHLGLAKLYSRTAREQQALENFELAMTMYREMDMGFWLEKAEAALKESGPKGGR